MQEPPGSCSPAGGRLLSSHANVSEATVDTLALAAKRRRRRVLCGGFGALLLIVQGVASDLSTSVTDCAAFVEGQQPARSALRKCRADYGQ
jgi:hypothetical protein